jgi:hypothetical protein
MIVPALVSIFTLVIDFFTPEVCDCVVGAAEGLAAGVSFVASQPVNKTKKAINISKERIIF